MYIRHRDPGRWKILSKSKYAYQIGRCHSLIGLFPLQFVALKQEFVFGFELESEDEGWAEMSLRLEFLRMEMPSPENPGPQICS